MQFVPPVYICLTIRYRYLCINSLPRFINVRKKQQKYKTALNSVFYSAPVCDINRSKICSLRFSSATLVQIRITYQDDFSTVSKFLTVILSRSFLLSLSFSATGRNKENAIYIYFLSRIARRIVIAVALAS